jgi:hypothetical protein
VFLFDDAFASRLSSRHERRAQPGARSSHGAQFVRGKKSLQTAHVTSARAFSRIANSDDDVVVVVVVAAV